MKSESNQSERFFVPDAVIRFLVSITTPSHSDRVLNINLDPTIATRMIDERSHKKLDYIKSSPNLEEFTMLEHTYDVVLCGPTFGLPSVHLPDGNGEPSEEYWLNWSITHLSDSGRFAAIVPNGLLANYSQQTFRKFLLKRCSIQAVVELPLGWSQGTNVQASILLITPPCNPKCDIKMVRFSKFETIPWDEVASIVRGHERQSYPEIFTTFTVDASQISYERLDANYHDPKYSRIPPPDPTIFRAFPLKELLSIGGGKRFSESEFAAFGIPYIQVSNVGIDGNFYFYDAKLVDQGKIKYGKKAGSQHYHGIRGDLIITVAGTLGKVAFIDEKLPSYGIYINTSSRRLRVKDPTAILPEYLFFHLRTDIIQQQIARLKSGSVVPVLSNADLGKITLYIPSIESQRQILATIQTTVLKQIQKVLSRFYGFEPEQEKSSERKSLIKPALPPIEEVVRNSFPFPIARTFSMFQQSRNDKYVIQVSELVAFSESIIYYLSAICIVDQMTRLKIANETLLSDIQKSVEEHSIGKRWEVVSTIQKAARNDTSIRLFVPELANADISVCKELHERVRNTKSHSLPQDEFECKEIIDLFRPKIERLVENLRFLKDYRLVRVTPAEYHNKRQGYKFQYLMGDSDLFQTSVDYLDSFLSVETHHVILMNNSYEFLDLHPFYLFQGWRTTGKKEHLCFFKYSTKASKEDASKKLLTIESTMRAGNHNIADDGLYDLINSFMVS